MKCPFCHEGSNRVVDNEMSEGGFAVRRHRECLCCRRQYTTYERSEERSIKVVKKDGTRCPFDRQKIRMGLEKACWKRPISDEQIESVVVAVEHDVHARSEPEVPSTFLGELVMQHLRKLDQVAFVRFASVYRQFQDVQDFVDELDEIMARAKVSTPE
ncbi:MAG: transcriptional repressor NrdR [Planctomycetota bacterium]|nr:MAG: transcriptional repressor NrdR [Planctomycetota bacterium]